MHSRLPWLATALIVLVAVACNSETVPTETAGPTPTEAASPDATQTATPEPPTTTSGPTIVSTIKVPPFRPLEFLDNEDCEDISREQLPLADVKITDGTRSVDVVAEMAVTSREQAQGLMCRETVPAGTGMLFVWEEERNSGFWMFNTYAPLDIIYFRAQGGNVSLKQMAPCTRGEGEADQAWGTRCATEAAQYTPGNSYTTTLELPQGWLQSQGFDTNKPTEIVVSFTARG